MTQPLDRRRFLRTAGALLPAGGLAALGSAQDRPSSDLVNPDTQSTIDRGLAFLAGSQSNDGSIGDSRAGGGNVAITGLAALALMAGGHQPGRGKYGKQVLRAADHVADRAARATPVGYLSAPGAALSHDGMYQHGFGALFLAEVDGMMPDADRQKRVRDALEKAIALSVSAQNNQGGWRYEPRPSQADVSVTVAQLMALRAAKNAGLFVPKSTVDKTVEYIRACQQPDGGFCYIKNQSFSGSAFARSAAVIVGLFSAGIYEGKEIERGLAYLMQFIPGRRGPAREFRAEHYFYAQYYAALAMWTAGGNYWAEWFPAIRDELVSRATAPAGGRGWVDYHGTVYATAMACIVLQLPNNYLPILQK